MEKQDMFPEDVRAKADSIKSEWISPDEFEKGLILQVSKPIEKVSSKYGATEIDFLVKKGLLEKGQTFRYYFTDSDGEERKIDSKSSPLFIGIKSVEELGIGDWIKISRTGETTETRYQVERVDAPTNALDVHFEGTTPKDIPF